jgi:predicted nuclease with TOPRIM domain
LWSEFIFPLEKLLNRVKNKKMRKEILIVSIAAFILLAGIKIADAAAPLKVNSAAVKAWHEARCAKFKEKIAERASNTGEKYDKHLNAYNNLASRLNTLINRLEGKGYDVAQLKTDLSILNEKIGKFEEDYKILFERIDAAKGKFCDDEDAAIKTKLGDIRALIQAVRKDAKEIRAYYKNEIRGNILAVKKQKLQ